MSFAFLFENETLRNIVFFGIEKSHYLLCGFDSQLAEQLRFCLFWNIEHNFKNCLRVLRRKLVLWVKTEGKMFIFEHIVFVLVFRREGVFPFLAHNFQTLLLFPFDLFLRSFFSFVDVIPNVVRVVSSFVRLPQQQIDGSLQFQNPLTQSIRMNVLRSHFLCAIDNALE